MLNLEENPSIRILRSFGTFFVIEDRSCEVIQEQVHRSPYRLVEEEEEEEEELQSILGEENRFRLLYDLVFGPIADLLHGDELIIVPEGPLCLVPFAVLTDPVGKYLCESFNVRIAPSLTSLKLISNPPQGYHSDSGALLVGDPRVGEIHTDCEYRQLDPLPCAREEVEMIGHITNIRPLTGLEATKAAVLQRLNCDALIHIAAHASAEYGEYLWLQIQRGPPDCHGRKITY